MTDQFCISVPVGAYHPFLRGCLKSLAGQLPQPQIALLDASKDPRVTEIADEFENVLTYRRHGPDGGQSDAIREGWSKLSGGILGWLNADDVLFPHAIQRMAQVFNDEPSVGVGYGHSTIVDDYGRVKGYHWAVEPPSNSLFFNDIISQPSCFFRRDLYESVGGLDADLHYTMDWDLWVRFLESGAEFRFVDEALSQVLWTREAKTGGFSSERRSEIERILNKTASPGRRLKSRVGFGLHHFFEYMMPDKFSRLVRRALTSSGAVLFGLGRNGEIASTARVPIVHYQDTPCRQIIVVFEGNTGDLTIELEGKESFSKACGTEIVIDLAEPLQEGTTASLKITNRAKALAYLSHIVLNHSLGV